jgi:predicted secreted protein
MLRTRRTYCKLPAIAFGIALSIMGSSPMVQAAPPQAANGSERGHIAHLAAHAEQPVTPDIMVMVWAVERAGPDPTLLNKEVTAQVGQALTLVSKVTQVSTVTHYSTQPEYGSKGTRQGWRMRGEVTLKSDDQAALAQLATRLVPLLTLLQTRFEVSDTLRQREEGTLTERAINEYKRKATQIAKQFGYRDFALREVHVSASGDEQGPRPVMLMAKANADGLESAPLPVAAGKVTLRVTVQGSVMLER